MAEVLNLMQYCPTMEYLWDAIKDSGTWPFATKAEYTWLSFFSSDDEYETVIPYAYSNYTADSLSCRHALCLGTGSKWPYNFIKITGSAWKNVCTTSGYNILLIPTKYNGNFPGVAGNSNLICTYLPMDDSTIYSGQLYFPIVKLGKSNPCQIVAVPRNPITVTNRCPIIIFWSRFEKNGIEYLGAEYVVRFPSETSTSPTIYKMDCKSLV